MSYERDRTRCLMCGERNELNATGRCNECDATMDAWTRKKPYAYAGATMCDKRHVANRGDGDGAIMNDVSKVELLEILANTDLLGGG